jgi:hypothetical protein
MRDHGLRDGARNRMSHRDALSSENRSEDIPEGEEGHEMTLSQTGATQGTFAQGINNLGAVAGYFTDAHFVSHGFIRDALGNFTTFDVPGSATGGTFALCINAAGSVAGYYSDKAGLPRGFIRTRAGAFETITDDDPNYGNVVRSLNDLGMTAGYVTRTVN